MIINGKNNIETYRDYQNQLYYSPFLNDNKKKIIKRRFSNNSTRRLNFTKCYKFYRMCQVNRVANFIYELRELPSRRYQNNRKNCIQKHENNIITLSDLEKI